MHNFESNFSKFSQTPTRKGKICSISWINISIFSKLREASPGTPIILPFKKYLVKIRLKTLEILDTPLMMKFMVQCRVKYGQAPPPYYFPYGRPCKR